ncbi:hypothetical protein SLEP1_g2149 [Rubroshorea leprosula]|uniref:ACT domain-containing protein ACR n=1 Tax=Rubroshorea leprosula TaxID=152421 RepID=A0AAV5HQB6_9ROSI|nr:hypothetical protein SLEP1_g2149 [Rubroshorea leprosula]
MEEQLKNIIRKCEDDEKVARTCLSMGFTHIDPRLHQMLFADRNYKGGGLTTKVDYSPSFKPKITVESCEDKDTQLLLSGAKIVLSCCLTLSARSQTCSTLVFKPPSHQMAPTQHRAIRCPFQEYYIRHMDGKKGSSNVWKLQFIVEGLSLELCAKDRVGLLSEVTRILRENGLSVTRADVTTTGEKAVNVFDM